MLTGDKYTDLTNLINLYNESGKVVLTGLQDVDYQILNSLNVDDLSRVCRTNKYSQQLCGDSRFWILKYNNEDLPLIQYNNYNGYSLNMWLKLYKKTIISKENAINTLKVYDIEFTDEEKKSPIYIYNKSQPGYIETILRNVNIIQNNVRYLKIFPNESLIIVFPEDGNNEEFYLSKNNIIILLTFIYLYNMGITRFSIVCKKSPLIITGDDLSYSALEYKRYGILKAIKYYNKINVYRTNY